MIITRILGGLGNQMFQHAAGRALAGRRGVPLKVDIAGFTGYGLHHGFELERVFGCQTAAATAGDLRAMLGWQRSPLARRVLARPQLRALRKPAFVVEPHSDYWPGIDNVPDDCYLYGYWQSASYFQDAAAAVRADFTFRGELTGRNADLAARLRGSNSVSIHVRRGDYVTNAANAALYAACGPDYYAAAAAHLRDRVGNDFTFWIFSDDMAWCREHLDLGGTCDFVDHNQGEDSHVDMQLMALCRHHVIANSSFSWWGAWLDARPDTVVVAPRRWFATERSSRDLCPTEWVRL